MDNSTRRCVTLCPDNPNHFADWTTNTCVATCPPTFFADSSIRQCVTTCNQTNGLLAYTPLRLCVLTCLNNTFSYNGSCVTICPNSTAPFYYIDTTTRSCVSICPDYYFRDDSLGKCVTLGGHVVSLISCRHVTRADLLHVQACHTCRRVTRADVSHLQTSHV